ncbi:hypothetical protein SAMN00777080_2836 [Aquiflexum balticum DSM 16537]|uniref:Uncharacterized protein n=1 Tax=Aquiflexum balticum DSM 16537 TaxID=758820 RepID=A0A1W2H6V2_9BACT|nr:hypothetical protein SAMN00777080_2836 [Aquiflexum balticum DSM 16537]
MIFIRDFFFLHFIAPLAIIIKNKPKPNIRVYKILSLSVLITCLSHHDLLSRDFIVGSFFPNQVRDWLFSSNVHTYRDLCPRFSLTVNHTGVSARCSVRQFDGCSPEASGPSKGLSIGYPIVLHPFQSIRPAFKVDSSHTRTVCIWLVAVSKHFPVHRNQA